MQPQNGIVGDSSSIDLPQANIPQDSLMEEKRMANFTKTPEFQRIKDHCENKIKFYQAYLPDGRPVASVPKKDLEAMWIAANVVIGEFQSLIDLYHTAAEAVADAQKQ